MLETRLVLLVYISSAFSVGASFGLLVFLIPRLYRQKETDHRIHVATIEQAFQQRILEERNRVQEETLKKVSMELHDNLGQKIYLSQLCLSAVDEDTSKINEFLPLLSRLLNQASDDLHRLVSDMGQETIKFHGLKGALSALLDQIRCTGKYQAFCDESGPPSYLSQQQELIGYRIAQEAINNIIRHAAADTIRVHLKWSTQSLHLQISDNGKGIPGPQNGSNTGHWPPGTGLFLMQQRAAFIGALLSVNGLPHRGTNVSLSIPLIPSTH